jgi:hypothetical protein
MSATNATMIQPEQVTQQAQTISAAPAVAECGSRPTLPGKALFGLAGGIVKKMMPETESHPAALLVEILAQFGNVIGRTAFYKVEETEHRGNLFAVKVGATSKARKGTATARIKCIFKDIDPPWLDRHFSGLGSGEGVIWNVRDASGTGVGVADKRMFIRADEFASTLAVMKREGNALSQVLRSSWDGITLQITTKNNPANASGHHISIVGDVTQEELQSSLQRAEKFNGFANRFLWVYTERTKKLPFGGAALDFTKEIRRLEKAVVFARQQGRVFMDDNARKVWARAYDKLSEGQPGLLGAVTSRSEAQVIRLVRCSMRCLI